MLLLPQNFNLFILWYLKSWAVSRKVEDARVPEGNQYWRTEEILCKAIKLKNTIVAKGRESGSMLCQESFEF